MNCGTLSRLSVKIYIIDKEQNHRNNIIRSKKTSLHNQKKNHAKLATRSIGVYKA